MNQRSKIMQRQYSFRKKDTITDMFSPSFDIDVETNDLDLFLFLEEGIDKLISEYRVKKAVEEA